MNTQALFTAEDKPFKQFVKLSFGLHVAFLLMAILKDFILPSQIIEIPQSIRVDVVALPDKISEESSTPPSKKIEPVRLSSKEETSPKVSLKDAQKKALERLRAMRAIEKIENEVRASKLKNEQGEKPSTYKGNIISSGNSFSGISRLHVNDYLSELTTKIREHWVLPQWLSGANLKAAVLMSIDNRGYVVSKEIQASSGNSVFDESCLAAVAESSPFPPPPSEVRDAQILIRFPFE